MKFGVLRFPGSCDDVDALGPLQRVGDAVLLWHADRDLQGVDAVIVPGGFSYGDYLRAGAIARFAPVMEEVAEFAREGGLVLGICNGFQVLCEAASASRARCCPTSRCGSSSARWTLEVVERRHRLHARVRARAAAVDPGQAHHRPLLRPRGSARCRSRPPARCCCATRPGHNPNGSVRDIAGVCNERGNVFGLMPHPEHAVDPLTGSADGLTIFESMRAHVADRVPA